MSWGKLSRNTDVWASSPEALVQETWGELCFLYLCKAPPLMLGAASAEDCGVASSSLAASGAYPVTQEFHFGVAPETLVPVFTKREIQEWLLQLCTQRPKTGKSPTCINSRLEKCGIDVQWNTTTAGE